MFFQKKWYGKNWKFTRFNFSLKSAGISEEILGVSTGILLIFQRNFKKPVIN